MNLSELVKTVNEIEIDNDMKNGLLKQCQLNSSKRIHISKYKVIPIVLALILITTISVPAIAAVRQSYQQRMAALNHEQLEQYYQDIQNSPFECFMFSRENTASENERLKEFRNRYKEEGLFPEKDIWIINDDSDVKKNVLCFNRLTGYFHLPERELTDEEVLEIVDLWARYDYALLQINIEKGYLNPDGTTNLEKCPPPASSTTN